MRQVFAALAIAKPDTQARRSRRSAAGPDRKHGTNGSDHRGAAEPAQPDREHPRLRGAWGWRLRRQGG